MGKVKNGLVSLFFIAFLILPCTFLLIGGWQGVNPVPFSLLLFLVSVVAFFCVKYKYIQLNGFWRYGSIGAICSAGILLRVYYLAVTYSVPCSDMAQVYNVAAGTANASNLSYVLSYSHLFNEAMILKGIFSVFGVSFLAGKIFNIVVAALTIFVLGLSGRYIFRVDFPGLLPAAAFALHPALSIYTNVFTIEHVSMLALALFVYFLARLHRLLEEKKEIKEVLVFTVLTGLALGLFNICKAVGAIILIALGIGELFHIKHHFSKFRQSWKKILLVVAVLTVSYTGINIVYTTIAVSAGFTPAKTNVIDIIYHGLISKGNGAHNSAVKQEIQEIHAHYGEKADGVLMSLLLSDMKENPDAYKALLNRKARETWDSGYKYIYWAMPDGRYMEGYLNDYDISLWNDKLAATNRSNYLKVSQQYYGVIGILIAFGALAMVFFPSKRQYVFFISAIAIFGLGLLLLLMETNGRYKSILEPMLAICVGWGAYMLGEMLCFLWTRIRAVCSGTGR